MRAIGQHILILLAEDDDGDYQLIRDALRESRIRSALQRVECGEKLMDYLYHRNGFENSSRPGLILLDLKLSKKDGHECLREIKADPSLRMIPIVVLTNSRAEEDVFRTYQFGVNSFIRKPVTFGELVETVSVVGRYWSEIADIPAPADSGEDG